MFPGFRGFPEQNLSSASGARSLGSLPPCSPLSLPSALPPPWGRSSAPVAPTALLRLPRQPLRVCLGSGDVHTRLKLFSHGSKFPETDICPLVAQRGLDRTVKPRHLNQPKETP